MSTIDIVLIVLSVISFIVCGTFLYWEFGDAILDKIKRWF